MKIELRKRLVLLIALMSYLLTALCASIVLTGLTKIQTDLHLSQVGLSWIQNSYGLAFGSFILISGRLGDIYGRKAMMEISLFLFTISSLVIGISNFAALTIVLRFIQGIGAAILAPTTLALLMDYFSGAELTKAIAWYSSVAGLGTSIGLIVGGALADYVSWRDGFYLTGLVSLAMLILSIFVLEKASNQQSTKLDIWGSVFSILGSGLLVYALNGAKAVLLFFVMAIISLVIFVMIERHSEVPVMPLSILMDRSRLGALLARIFMTASMMGFYFFVSEYLQDYLHYNPLQTGIGFLPMTLVIFVAAIIVPRLIDQYGNRLMLIISSLLILIGFAWMVITGTHSYWQTIFGPEILFGIGQGFGLAPSTNLGIAGVSRENSGAASSVVNMFHQLGGVLGVAIMVMVSSALTSSTNFVGQFSIAMFVGLIMAILQFIMSLIVKRSNQ